MYAGCPNPHLTYSISVSGPADECIDEVEDHVEADCPDLCEICQRSFNEDSQLSEGEDYVLQHTGCLEEDDPPYNSISGWIQCKCGPQIGKLP